MGDMANKKMLQQSVYRKAIEYGERYLAEDLLQLERLQECIKARRESIEYYKSKMEEMKNEKDIQI